MQRGSNLVGDSDPRHCGGTIVGAPVLGDDARMDAPATDTDRHRPPRICTIGDLILDVVVLPRAPLVADADTPATIRFTTGGQAANVAAWASALGAQARLVCKRGTDVPAELAAAELGRHGVEICGPIAPGSGGVVVSIRTADGQRTMASDRGVAALLEPRDLDPAWIETSEVLHVSGYCLLRESMARAAIAAAHLAARVTVDLASANDISIIGPDRFAQRVAALAPELAFATESERAALPDLGDLRWVTKLGPRGAEFPEGHRPALPATVVDTTGAGDALAAGYLVGGPDLAMAAAARCVGLIGAMPSDAHDVTMTT